MFLKNVSDLFEQLKNCQKITVHLKGLFVVLGKIFHLRVTFPSSPNYFCLGSEMPTPPGTDFVGRLRGGGGARIKPIWSTEEPINDPLLIIRTCVLTNFSPLKINFCTVIRR
jgi:hypothetical protein